MKFFLTIVFIFLSLNLFADDKASSIFKKYSSKVVYIESKVGMGTGFFIEPDVILTNRHVVFGYDKNSGKWNSPQKITLHSGKVLNSYQFLVCSVNVDICIIGLEKNSKSSPGSIKFANRPVKAGEDVYVIGHPHGVTVPIISTGIVSSEFANVPWDDIFGKNSKFLGFSTTAAISHGSSGSPVIAKSGEVLGIAVGFLNDSQNLNLVISTNEINQFIKYVFDKNKSETIAFSRGFEKELDSKISQRASLSNTIDDKEANISNPLPIEKVKSISQIEITPIDVEKSIPLNSDIESNATNESSKGFDSRAPKDSVMVAGVSVVDTAPMAKFEISDTSVKETKAEVKSESIVAKVDNKDNTEETTTTTNMDSVTTTIGDLTAPSRMKNDSSTSSPLVAAVPVKVIYVSTINPNAIRKVLRDHIPQFRYCYQNELDLAKNSEAFKGVINLRFFIASAGKVIRSEVTSDVIISEKVPECIKNVLQGIQFPEPKNGGTVEVNQPMNLYTKRI
jgi:hypothetical protein